MKIARVRNETCADCGKGKRRPPFPRDIRQELLEVRLLYTQRAQQQYRETDPRCPGKQLDRVEAPKLLDRDQSERTEEGRGDHERQALPSIPDLGIEAHDGNSDER